VNKNIVICLDGTGNKFNEESSNVVKLYRVLMRKPEKQIVYYDPGVGTLADPEYKIPVSKALNKILGLAFGYGMTKNIAEAYSYLMDNYKTGDNVFIFGFSRGAYAARALAGLIHSVGILEQGNQSLIPYAIELYKAKNVDFEVLAKFKKTFGRTCDIKFLGIWDSVRTVGWVYDPVFFPYTTNNVSVQAIRHAISIDEKRTLFLPLYWGGKFCEKQDIKEVWFAGVHADVGGGYPESESGLAKISLEWMINEAIDSKFGLIIDPVNYERYVLGLNKDKKYTKPDSNAKMHDTLTGIWKVVQYFPLGVWDNQKKRKNTVMPERIRKIPDTAILHHSVLERIEDSDYKPLNLDIENLTQYKVE